MGGTDEFEVHHALQPCFLHADDPIVVTTEEGIHAPGMTASTGDDGQFGGFIEEPCPVAKAIVARPELARASPPHKRKHRPRPSIRQFCHFRPVVGRADHHDTAKGRHRVVIHGPTEDDGAKGEGHGVDLVKVAFFQVGRKTTGVLGNITAVGGVPEEEALKALAAHPSEEGTHDMAGHEEGRDE